MKYVICIDNKDYESSLEVRKLYRVADESYLEDNLISIIDESGETYLYSKNMFMEVEIPNEIVEKLEFETV